jgi:hypothetical protein
MGRVMPNIVTVGTSVKAEKKTDREKLFIVEKLLTAESAEKGRRGRGEKHQVDL